VISTGRRGLALRRLECGNQDAKHGGALRCGGVGVLDAVNFRPMFATAIITLAIGTLWLWLWI
jgi:hypothetical protein